MCYWILEQDENTDTVRKSWFVSENPKQHKMNFVMPSLVNSTENISSLSDKWEANSNLIEETTVLPVLASFGAMILGAACMLCFVGKLLSKWYTLDLPPSETESTETKLTDADSKRSASNKSRKCKQSDDNVAEAIEMNPIKSTGQNGFMLKYAIYNSRLM